MLRVGVLRVRVMLSCLESLFSLFLIHINISVFKIGWIFIWPKASSLPRNDATITIDAEFLKRKEPIKNNDFPI